MPRKTSRRFTNYYKQNDEQQANDQQRQQQFNDKHQRQFNEGQHPQPSQQPQQQHSGDYENKANNNNNDSIIADMAQGFIQAQAAVTDKAMNFNNQEITELLQKLHNQLEEIKKSTPNSDQTGAQSSKSPTGQDSRQQNTAEMTTQDNSSQQADEGPSKELKELLTSVLQGKSNNKNSANKSSNTQDKDVNKTKGEKSPQNMMAVQTVSQVLAQAQYELANELETSLKKLKQVISESEKLANNISNLLGEETMKKL